MARSRVRATLTALGVAVAFVVGSTVVGAAPLPGGEAPVISLHIDSSAGGYGYSASQQGTLNADGRTWDMVGNGYSNDGVIGVSWDLNVDPDPFIAGTFNLTNLSATTQQFVLTATLPATPMPGPNVMGGFFGGLVSDPIVGVRFTDQNGDSAVTLSTVGTNPFYQAFVDSLAVPGTAMGSFSLSAFGGPGVFGSVSRHSFGDPIPSDPAPAVLSSIGIRVEFELSAGDRVQIPVRFEVAGVPEPGALVLLGLGLASLALVRRARA